MKKVFITILGASFVISLTSHANLSSCAGKSNTEKYASKDIERAKLLAGKDIKPQPKQNRKKVVKAQGEVS